MCGLIALAFLVPLGLTLADRAREAELADAARRAALVTGALAVSTDTAAVERAVAAAAGDDPALRPVVHGIGADESAGRADAAALADAAAQRRSVVTEVDGGVLRLDPVVLGERVAVVEVFVPDEALDEGGGRWLLLLGIALALVGAAVVVVDRVAARAVDATGDLVKAALAVGDGELGVRVEPTGPRELAEAGHAFNRMTERLVALRADEHELVADLSHRLRTPLTALRLDAEALESDDTSIGTFSEAELDRRRGIRRIRQAIVTLEGEVDQLIKTTRKAVSQESAPASCDVSEVVRDRMVFWSALAGDQNRPHRVVGAQLRIPAPVPRAELAAALDAVIGNVFRYTPQGTAFEVAVSRRDGWVAIRIDDAGPGIPNPDRALRRGESDQGSTGLGLDIAKRVALQANGSVSIDRARLGGASVVMLLADPDAAPRPVNRFGLVGRMARDAREPRAGRRWPRPR
ncbi:MULTISPECIES: HAMP domain-containing sensor histidine kinase [Micromonospora]|uniref:HAMP domain-containing sensor histidine kinase n=2 Tax=Micromonosporaceae TaxID=28056 RepID=UPI000A9B3508|nr:MULTISPECIES: HAMP domain-containing sensor histidine kinase [Micromonospora]MBC8991189.1 HAMP domain-containing histidine kinase [Micromonospora chalcea]MBP1782526.1 signal transduction histidine kinase [Micromonospora sp. HB375]MCK1807764.1 HAMP domain-containing histidine kinase [Micromonospora sp. R42106]MCK1832835.1 HAMP domain-containing histidine kinase [Micromonospora sp. R42003]MCK1844303.1 HAMP domain-containing histidine kinase [Micromonospora sp. R42004]